MINAPNLDAVYLKVGAFIAAIIEDAAVPIVCGLANRVPAPAGAYVAITATIQSRLATNHEEYTDPFPDPGAGLRTVTMPTQLQIQMDFYGPLSGNWAQIAEMLLRDEYGCAALAPECQPLHMDTAAQAALTTGEQQYQERWILTGVFQTNPAVALPQQFADEAVVGLINVDVRYPPA